MGKNKAAKSSGSGAQPKPSAAPAAARPAAAPAAPERRAEAQEEDADAGGEPADADGEQDDDDSRPLPSPVGPRVEDDEADYEVEKPFEVPTEFLKPADDGDCLVVSAAAGGLFLCMAVAAALPSWGVPAEHVMAAGMLTLLTGILYAVFVPSCGARRGKDGRATPGAEDVVTPVAVFLVTGCIGTMLGGMFGSTLKYMRWEDYLAPFKG